MEVQKYLTLPASSSLRSASSPTARCFAALAPADQAALITAAHGGVRGHRQGRSLEVPQLDQLRNGAEIRQKIDPPPFLDALEGSSTRIRKTFAKDVLAAIIPPLEFR